MDVHVYLTSKSVALRFPFTKTDKLLTFFLIINTFWLVKRKWNAIGLYEHVYLFINIVCVFDNEGLYKAFLERR